MDTINPTILPTYFLAPRLLSSTRILLILSFCGVNLWGQLPGANTRKIEVTLINEPISIDGVLDEAAWLSTPTIGNLIQREPDTGQAPSEKTEIKLLRDKTIST